jgi:hypothetical protein
MGRVPFLPSKDNCLHWVVDVLGKTSWKLLFNGNNRRLGSLRNFCQHLACKRRRQISPLRRLNKMAGEGALLTPAI